MFKTKILASSVNPAGSRLVTYQVTYPRFIHSEFMTHRAFSRNAASSRAIPVEKQISAVRNEWAEFAFWGKNQKGMQASEEFTGEDLRFVQNWWGGMAQRACEQAAHVLEACDPHKQIINRVLEPYSHITVIVTMEERGARNFFSLRMHKDAQPEFQVVAYQMAQQWLTHPVDVLDWEEWHIPLGDVTPEDAELELEDLLKAATGRIARVSYLTHDGVRDPAKDIELHDRLMTSGHWSPFEHCAQAKSVHGLQQLSNFGPGWLQYRKTFPEECQVITDEDLTTRLMEAPEWVKRAANVDDSSEAVA